MLTILAFIAVQAFSEDHRDMIGRAQQLRRELADWRHAAAIKTKDYTEEIGQLQNELLQSMQEIQQEIQAMRSKVRAVLAIHGPAAAFSLVDGSKASQ